MIKMLYNKIRIWFVCTLKGHKYNYQLGWGERGNYDDIWFVCDRCDKKFFRFFKSQVPHWFEMEQNYKKHIKALEDELKEAIKLST